MKPIFPNLFNNSSKTNRQKKIQININTISSPLILKYNF